MSKFRVGVFALLAMSFAVSADAWVASGPVGGTQSAIAMDSNGDVLVVGHSDSTHLVAFKRSGADGALAWEAPLASSSDPYSYTFNIPSIAVDDADDAFVVGVDIAAQSLFVTKLDGSTGGTLWRHDELDPSITDVLRAARPIPYAGRVLVAGWIGSRIIVLALDALDGSLVWRADLLDDGFATDFDRRSADWTMAGHPTGDVVVATIARTTNELRVTRLGGADGSIVWQVTPGPLAGHAAVLTEPSGDVFATAGNVDGNTTVYTVFRLAAADGSILWQFQGSHYGDWAKLLLAADGDVLSLNAYWAHAQLARLDGATGTADWTANTQLRTADLLANGDVAGVGNAVSGSVNVQRFSGNAGAELWGLATVGEVEIIDGVARDGFVAAIASVSYLQRHFATIGLSTRLPGTKLLLRDVPGNPADSRLVVQAKDPRLAAPYADGSSQDPSVGGGTLTISNPTTGESSSILLPAEYWTAIASKPGGEGQRYKDTGGATGCRVVVLRSGRKFKVRCDGPLLGFTLDEPQQTALRIALKLGTGPTYCLEFGGSVVQDVSTAGTGRGIFLAKDATTPTSCPGGL